MLRALLAACALAICSCGVDSPDGQSLRLSDQPPAGAGAGDAAVRIISLAPHLTEMVFAAGAGDTLVGVVEYSDYPDAAKILPRVGDAFRVDIERVMALDPDLVLAWSSGNPPQMVDQLLARDIPVTRLEPGGIEQIAEQIEFIGDLAGTADKARATAAAFRQRLTHLKQLYAGRDILTVFYQISPRPLYTINERQIISEAISYCGGSNIFADLNELAPIVSPEAVVAGDPQVIIAPRFANEDPFERWRAIESMRAVRHNALYTVDADLVARATPRLLDGVVQICEAMDAARGMQ